MKCSTGKECYGKREAHEKVKGMKWQMRKGRDSNKRSHKSVKIKPQRIYFCVECRQWHITSLSSFNKTQK